MPAPPTSSTTTRTPRSPWSTTLDTPRPPSNPNSCAPPSSSGWAPARVRADPERADTGQHGRRGERGGMWASTVGDDGGGAGYRSGTVQRSSEPTDVPTSRNESRNEQNPERPEDRGGRCVSGATRYICT